MRRKYWVLLIFCVGVLFLDQWTKYLVVQKLPLYQGVEVIQGFFNLTHMRNTGGAFGIFGGGGRLSPIFPFLSPMAYLQSLAYFQHRGFSHLYRHRVDGLRIVEKRQKEAEEFFVIFNS